jgi:Dolichyl-phosphate-mannose-protein mannosyltransferase
MEADSARQTRSTPPLAPRLSAAAAVLAGGGLRAWMLHKFFEVSGDSQLYGGMAKNLLIHGQYALSDASGKIHPTLIRLPGYPLFLAGCFRLFGMENYWSASVVQIVLALAGCILLSRFAARITPPQYRTAAGQSTLWLSALCPFTAIYDAEPLSEGLTLFCIALGLWSAARFVDDPGWKNALVFTSAVAYSALLRPDGALVGVALAPAVILRLLGRGKGRAPVPQAFRFALVCVLLALAPFAAWTWRNWRTFHVIQPLAPRYATDPGENTWPDFQKWVKTWSLDFVSTYEIYWNVPSAPIDIAKLPERAFDSPDQRAETASIVAAYESNGEELSSDLDARFAALARERIRAHPLRYYLILPLGRVADMWLRPRIENLPIDLDWWVYSHHRAETRFSWFYAGLNAFYLLLGIVGLCLRPRLWPWMLTFIILRSALLSTIEAPEARYTLECFPMIFALGGVALGWLYSRRGIRV